MAALGLEHRLVDKVADDARQENDEGIDHTLDQGQGHHVAVGDVADFVSEHGLRFVPRHVVEQAGADRDQRAVLVHAGGEGVDVRRVIDRHIGHADSGTLRLAPYGFHQPAFALIGRRFDDLRAGHELGRPLGHRQRDECAAETNHTGEHQQRSQVEPTRGILQVAVDAQQPHRDVEDEQNGQVGDQEQDNAFEHVTPFLNKDTTTWIRKPESGFRGFNRPQRTPQAQRKA